MVPQRDRVRLVPEPLSGAVVERGSREHLERDPPTERELLRLVNNAHPAAADFAEEAEVAQVSPRRQRTGRSSRSAVVSRPRRGRPKEVEAVQAPRERRGHVRVAGHELRVVRATAGGDLRLVFLKCQEDARVLRQFFPRGHDGSPRREIRCWGNSSGAGRAPRQGSGREWECRARGC